MSMTDKIEASLAKLRADLLARFAPEHHDAVHAAVDAHATAVTDAMNGASSIEENAASPAMRENIERLKAAEVVKRESLGTSASVSGNGINIETVTYTDGTTATGTAPLPNKSSAQQDAEKASGKPNVGAEDARTAEQIAADDVGGLDNGGAGSPPASGGTSE